MAHEDRDPEKRKIWRQRKTGKERHKGDKERKGKGRKSEYWWALGDGYPVILCAILSTVTVNLKSHQIKN